MSVNSFLVQSSAFGKVNIMRFKCDCFSLLAVVALCFISSPALGAESEADKSALAVEALSRLQGVDLETNPKLKETVLKLLEKTRGTPSFVKLVQQFKLSGQNSGLLEVALAQPAGESGIEAMRMILASGDTAIIEKMLAATNTITAAKTAEALGNSGEKQAVRMLLPVLTEAQRDFAVRKQAVRALARTSEGARDLLLLAKEQKLSEELKFTASSELNSARWPEIKAEAARLLPLPPGQNAQPLPPISELVKAQGDPANGAKVFSRQSPGCANCHVVNGQGAELGPNLSEIGSKLGKDALYEAILDPSTGVSFGYEAFNLTLKNGDEAYGLVSSETADEITLRNVGGIVTKYKKSEITSRQQSKLSIMPAGLQQGMTTQEFVDLVEYLSTLKKAQ
jgi:putative heme-binding domain-containing protein